MYRIAVTNRKLCGGDFLGRIRQLAAGSYYDAIVLREKDLTQEEYRKLAQAVLEICRENDKMCMLHGTFHVALELHHPFIHLPLSRWESLDEESRTRLRRSMKKIGTSVHSEQELKMAVRLGADYVFAGHIFPTDCKKGVAPRGLDFLQDICRKSSVPVYAIGGIKPDNENLAAQRGAAGVCIMSASMQGIY